MNIKPILRHELHGHFQVFRIVYGVMYGIIIAAVISIYWGTRNAYDTTVSSADFSTMIAMFIIGLTFFKDPFRFFSSYGVSRKRLFVGLIASLGITSAATALLDCVNAVIFSRFINNYHSIYAALTDNGYIEMGIQAKLHHGGELLPQAYYTPLFLLKNFVWCLAAYFLVAMVGLFITVLYYRMNKTQKTLVSVGVPGFFFLLLPLLDQHVMAWKIGQTLTSIAGWWVTCGMNPLTDLLTRLLLAAVFAGITYCMIRKVDIKA